MTQRHSPQQQYQEAQQFARDYGMFIVEKGGKYLLYRRAAPRNVFLGSRGSVAGLRKFVESCAGSTPRMGKAA